MRTVIGLLVLAGLVAALWFLAWHQLAPSRPTVTVLPKEMGAAREPGSRDGSALAAAVLGAADRARRKRGLTPLAADEGLDLLTARRVEVVAQRAAGRLPGSSSLRKDDEEWFRDLIDDADSIGLVLLHGAITADLEREILRIDDLYRREWNHAAAAARRVADPNAPEWIVLVVLARIPRPIDTEQLDAGEREFRVRCRHCAQRFLVEFPETTPEERGTVALDCPECGCYFDVFALDTRGRYHRPPWFLPGNAIPPTTDAVDAWLTVLATIRYADDEGLFGLGDAWQRAEETLAQGIGDCEDTAILLADWLLTGGHDARVVLGKVEGEGHAWVALQQGDAEYVLETTGGTRNFTRVPPRAALMTDFAAETQFNRDKIWYSRRPEWVSSYSDTELWLEVAN